MRDQISPDTRRAALIATAVTVPLVVIIALLIGGAATTSSPPTSGSTTPAVLGPVTVSPPPDDPAVLGPCAKVIGALPLTVAGQNAREAVSSPSSPDVVAWGDPAIVLRCGVSRPAALHAGSTALLPVIDGVVFSQRIVGDVNTFTAVDRSVYVEVQVPTSYVAGGVMAPIANAIGRSLPQVCVAQALPNEAPVAPSRLCVNRP